ncbi:MAG: Crp/Fnr family transcriptional regulator [Termitinemataceae bacterium]
MENLTIYTYPVNGVVFKEGDPGDVMYILIEGAVELRKRVNGAEVVLKTIDQKNDFFGEMALIDGKPRSATAVAIRPTKLLPVNYKAFEKLIETNGTFALKIIGILSERIRQANEQIEELVNTNPRDRINYAIVDFALRQNTKIFDGRYKVPVEELKSWLNSRCGVSVDDIDAHLFRLLKAESLAYATSKDKGTTDLLLSASFTQQYNRRRA